MTDEPNPATSPPPPMPALRADSRDPQGGFEPLEGGCDLPNIMNKLLKRPLSLIYSLESDEDGRQIPLRLLLISIASLVVFGLVIGTFSWQEQIWAAPLKIVSGLLFSGLICLPSLYIFACLGGLDAKFRTIVGVLCGLIALSGLLLVGFAPVVWLFSVSSTSITFLGFLLLSLWIVCAGFGLVLVFRAGRALGMTNTAHLTIWCGVFLLVTLQMTTTLRPIIGTSDHLVNFQEKKFFLSYWREQLNGEYEERDEREEEPGASER